MHPLPVPGVFPSLAADAAEVAAALQLSQPAVAPIKIPILEFVLSILPRQPQLRPSTRAPHARSLPMLGGRWVGVSHLECGEQPAAALPDGFVILGAVFFAPVAVLVDASQDRELAPAPRAKRDKWW